MRRLQLAALRWNVTDPDSVLELGARLGEFSDWWFGNPELRKLVLPHAGRAYSYEDALRAALAPTNLHAREATIAARIRYATVTADGTVPETVKDRLARIGWPRLRLVSRLPHIAAALMHGLASAANRPFETMSLMELQSVIDNLLRVSPPRKRARAEEAKESIREA